MATVRIPPALRSTVGSREVEVTGGSVGEALNSLTQEYPPVRAQLFDSEGGLQPFVNVYLNEQDIQYLNGLETPAGKDDTIIILPAMAGGGMLANTSDLRSRH